jgi:hypothetical protein
MKRYTVTPFSMLGEESEFTRKAFRLLGRSLVENDLLVNERNADLGNECNWDSWRDTR